MPQVRLQRRHVLQLAVQVRRDECFGGQAAQGAEGGGVGKVLTPQAKRDAVAVMRDHTAVSERRACGLVGISRSVLRYEAVRTAEDEALRGRVIDLVQQRRRFGYRRIYALLRREGVTANHKKVLRLYQEEGLAVRKRWRRQGVAVDREPLELPSGPILVTKKHGR